MYVIRRKSDGLFLNHVTDYGWSNCCRLIPEKDLDYCIGKVQSYIPKYEIEILEVALTPVKSDLERLFELINKDLPKATPELLTMENDGLMFMLCPANTEVNKKLFEIILKLIDGGCQVRPKDTNIRVILEDTWTSKEWRSVLKYYLDYNPCPTQ